jgi:hypothetical protein
MPRPKIFIGSTTEKQAIAKQVHSVLQNVGDVSFWPNVFAPGEPSIEAILDIAKEVDFGVFLVTGDDKVISRGVEHTRPRDNIIFELGIFMAKVGRGRTFIVYGQNEKPILPSDLNGLVYIPYRLQANIRDPRQPDIPNSLVAPCHTMEGIIQQKGTLAEEQHAQSQFKFGKELFGAVGTEWFANYEFDQEGRLWKDSPYQPDLTRGLSLYWAAHDLLWTVIALKSNQDASQIRRGLCAAAWQLEQSGLCRSPEGTYNRLRDNAKVAKDMSNDPEYWTEQRRHELSRILLNSAHDLGLLMNNIVLSVGPKGYLPLPPRPGVNDEAIAAFL